MLPRINAESGCCGLGGRYVGDSQLPDACRSVQSQRNRDCGFVLAGQYILGITAPTASVGANRFHMQAVMSCWGLAAKGQTHRDLGHFPIRRLPRHTRFLRDRLSYEAWLITQRLLQNPISEMATKRHKNASKRQQTNSNVWISPYRVSLCLLWLFAAFCTVGQST